MLPSRAADGQAGGRIPGTGRAQQDGVNDQSYARSVSSQATDDPDAPVPPIRADGVPLASPFGDEPELADEGAPIAGPPEADAAWVAPSVLEGADPIPAVAAEVAAETANDTPEDEGEV